MQFETSQVEDQLSAHGNREGEKERERDNTANGRFRVAVQDR